jgi:hypothetical protein
MKASYGVDVSKFNKSSKVWSQDAMLKDMTRYTMSKQDTDEVNEHLSNAGKIFNKIASSTLRELEANQTLARTIETFNNTFVRRGTVVVDTKRHVNNLVRYITNKYQKEVDAAKSEKGKASRAAKMNEVLKFFSPANKNNLKLMFDLQKSLILAKLKIINILQRLSNTETFLKTKNGFKVTGQEGYVAIDTLGGDAVKIVDRMEFSYANFSPDILKGWDKPTRN